MFLKTFGKIYRDMKKENYCFDVTRLNSIYAGLHDMSELWEQAEEGELTLKQLQERLQQIADCR